MKAVLTASICSLALACGGTQPSSDSSPLTSPAPATTPAQAPTPGGTSDDQARLAAAVEKLSQEQAEMFQLFQLLAGQVQSLQDEVEELRGQQAAIAAPPPIARPTRPRPDPATTYSVQITNNPSRGSKQPLVTIVEAFEFA